MRWGVPEEAQNDHLTSELCIREVEKCQRLSIGPSCIVCISTLTIDGLSFILMLCC